MITSASFLIAHTELWIDCEWNDYGGELISMALVDADDDHWYGVLECQNPSRWVSENVINQLIPVDGHYSCAPIYEKVEFKIQLEKFLSNYHGVRITADWPEDIAHFCNATITGPGTRIKLPHLVFDISTIIDSSESKQPHNALADARSMRDMWFRLNGRTRK